MPRDPVKDAPARTFLVEPFDILLHATEDGLQALQTRFANWLRALHGPARFVCWQIPATLDEKIAQISRTARETDDPQRGKLLMEYRRHYELLQDSAEYQRALCGMALWTDENPRALAAGMTSAFDTPVVEAAWPALFDGNYALRDAPFWHLAPTGRPGGRPLWAILTSYEFMPSVWNFFRPLAPLLRLNFPLALAVDIARTFDRNEGIDAVESIIAAYQVHLATLRGEDSRSVTRVADCRRALQEMNQGDALHLAQVTVAIAAPDVDTLKARSASVVWTRRPCGSYFAYVVLSRVGSAVGVVNPFASAVVPFKYSVLTTTFPWASRLNVVSGVTDVFGAAPGRVGAATAFVRPSAS